MSCDSHDRTRPNFSPIEDPKQVSKIFEKYYRVGKLAHTDGRMDGRTEVFIPLSFGGEVLKWKYVSFMFGQIN